MLVTTISPSYSSYFQKKKKVKHMQIVKIEW